MIAEVIIQSNAKDLNRVFDYKIPTEYEENALELIGARVLVSFARRKELEEGYIVNIKESTEYEVKEIAKIEEKYLNNEKIELANWMSKRYFCNIADCLKLMLPPGSTRKVSNRVKEKSVNFVTLKKDEDEIEFDIETGKLKSAKQIRILKFLLENGDALISDMESENHSWFPPYACSILKYCNSLLFSFIFYVCSLTYPARIHTAPTLLIIRSSFYLFHSTK